MVVEAGQFCFKRLLDRTHSNSPGESRGSRLQTLPVLEQPMRDLTNLKHRLMPAIARNRQDIQSLNQKEDLHRIRMELGKQIQRDVGRSRIQNLQFFQKLERKDQRDMRLEAKTILLSIKKQAKLGEKGEAVCQKAPVKKKSKGLDVSVTLLNPLRLTSTVGIMERFSKSSIRPSLLASAKHLADSVVEKRESHTALRSGMESTGTCLEDNSRRQSIDRHSQGLGSSLQIMNSGKALPKRKGSGSMQLQMNKFSQCQKMERYKTFLKKVSFANRLYIQSSETPSKKLVYHIGRGNNSELVRSLMKRRYWWTEGPIELANFVWTQLKKQDIFNRQTQYQEDNMTCSGYLNISVCSDSSRSDSELRWQKTKSIEPPASEDKVLAAAELQEWLKQPQTKLLRKVDPRLAHNHMPGNCHLGNKKALFFNLRQYCQLTGKELFDMVPLTFHIGEEYKHFERQYRKRAQLIKDGAKLSNVWIVKPGENSNRGNGIHVIDSLKELDDLLAERRHHSNGEQLTYIVQQYMSRPFLYNKRKFDIRHYLLITSFGRSVRAYWYRQGYIRTSSQLFDLQNTKNSQIHLTNDAIQKHSEAYGKYQQANKLSYSEFQRYLQLHFKDKRYNFAEVLARMREIATQAVRATYSKLDPTNKQFNFQVIEELTEVFGLDFMLDENLKPWLIEVNTNPCLELSSNLLGRIIPNMIEHALRMSLDPLFPPPADCSPNQRHYIACKVQEYLKFELIFSSEMQGPALQQLYLNQQQPQLVNIEQDDEQYCDQGRAINFVE